MTCPTCGHATGRSATVCAACGAALVIPQPDPYSSEQVLYRCGPMGIGISSRRPGVFVVTYQNCTEVVVTDIRLCGVRTMPRFVFARHRKGTGKVVFSVLWGDVVAVERADYLLNTALWIRYREGVRVKELGIEAGLPWRDTVLRIEELVTDRL